jgi:uncharacterized protein with GYD domain
MKYIILGHLSPEWIGRPRERVQSVKAKAAELDITIDGIYYTQGQYDFVALIRATDPYVALAFTIWYAKQGYGRMATMPAFDEASMDSAVEKI